VLGPVGFFVGTTQMGFDMTITNASGRLRAQKQVQAAVRSESESTKVAGPRGIGHPPGFLQSSSERSVLGYIVLCTLRHTMGVLSG
jgi:hypothetical protein